MAGACPARNYVITFESSGFYSHMQPFSGALVISMIKAGTSLKPRVVPELFSDDRKTALNSRNILVLLMSIAFTVH